MARKWASATFDGRPCGGKARAGDQVFGLLTRVRELSQQKENAVFAKLIRLLKNEDGATAIEYGMVAALVAVAAVTVLSTVGANLTGTSTRAANKL
jgi:pilus assembly protein Flp/PilA